MTVYIIYTQTLLCTVAAATSYVLGAPSFCFQDTRARREQATVILEILVS